MKIKFLLLLLPFACFAQEVENNCSLEAKEIEALVQKADYDKAFAVLENTKCISESHYWSAEKTLLYKLAAPASDDDKKKYLASLLKLYTNDDKNFPGNKRANLVKRANAMLHYKSGTDAEIFALYDKAFKSDRETFTDARGLYEYFKLYFAKHSAGEKGVTNDALIEMHDEVVGRMTELAESFPGQKRDFRTAIDNIKALTKSIFTCQMLEDYYEKRLVSHKKDSQWLRRATENLIAEKCTETATVSKLASAWYDSMPDAKSAHAMGIVSLRSRDNQSKALGYFEEAVSKETDASRKSDTYMTMASIFTSSDLVRAIEYARKAIDARPENGKAYLVLAQLYVSTECGKTPFEKKALYRLAAETVMNAVTVVPTMKQMAEIVSAKYVRKAPTKDEIREAKMDGKTITFGCGINQSVTFPK